MTTEIIKKEFEITRNKKKKHNKIVILAKIKLNSFKTLIVQALIYVEISHEDFKRTKKVKQQNYERK